jgi:hypothetical protein
MADYHPLIAKAVAGLERNTGEARRALYERARTALVAQLRGVEPALSESDITRERLALEEAIRKVEGEAARRARTEFSRPDGNAAARPDDPPRADGGRSPPAATVAPAIAPATAKPEARASAPAPEPVAGKPAPPSGKRLSLTDQGLKGFRDVIAEADDLGGAAAQAGRSARQAYAAVPSPAPELDRIEPRIETDGFRAPAREAPAGSAAPAPANPSPVNARADAAPRREQPVGRPQPLRTQPPGRDLQPVPDLRGPGTELRPQAPGPNGAARAPVHEEVEQYEPAPPPPRSYAGLIKIFVAICVVAALAGLFVVLRPKFVDLIEGMRGQPALAGREPTSTSPAARPKITDRVGGQEKTAAVAQRVVLYEEDPNDPQGKRFVGTAVWRTETVSPGPGLAPELAVRADVDIPERKMTMQWSIRRNTDKALPASHTIEIIFTVPGDFPSGGIANVPGILMKQSEQNRGVPLSGLAVKVMSGYFLIGLSATDTEVQRNMELLKDREWFDIPVVYGNNRRAIIAMEKGTPGDRAFAEAFAAWGKVGSQ